MDENRKNLYQDEGRETRREIQCHMSNKTEGTQGYTHVWMATEPSSDRSRRWVLVCMDLHTLLTLTRTPQTKQLWAVPVLPVRCPEKRWGSGVFSAGLPGCRCPPQAHSHWTGWRGGRRSSWSRAGLGGGSGPLCAHSSPPDATYLQRRGSSFDLISFQFHQCCEQKEITWVEPAVGRIQMEPKWPQIFGSVCSHRTDQLFMSTWMRSEVLHIKQLNKYNCTVKLDLCDPWVCTEAAGRLSVLGETNVSMLPHPRGQWCTLAAVAS